MTGFDRRLKQLLLKVRARAEREGIEWRKADDGVFAFRAGPYVVTFARDRDPLIAIYDENGDEVEAVDAADFEGRAAPDGAALDEIKNRIWRLARRGAGVSAAALDGVLDWLDERIEDESGDAEDDAAGDLNAAHGDIEEPDLAPQAPQAGAAPGSATVMAAPAPAAQAEPEADSEPRVEDISGQAADAEAASEAEAEEEGEEDKPGSENGSMTRNWTGARPPWAR